MIYNLAMNYKDIVKRGYNTIADRYLAERAREAENVRLLDELIERLPAGAKVLDAGCGAGIKPGGYAFLCLGAEHLIDDIEEDYLGTRMYWSHYDAETYLNMLKECDFSLLWSRNIPDETCEGAAHWFVLAQK